MKSKIVYCFLIAIIAFISCSKSPVSDGSSTETGNVKAIIDGIVQNADSTYLNDALVYVHHTDYLPGIFDDNIPVDTTNVNGYFLFESADTGVFLINILKGDTGAMTYCTLSTDTSVVSFNPIRASETGRCVGNIEFTGGDDDVIYGDVYIRYFGTGIVSRANDITGKFSTANLSAGIYSVQIYPVLYPGMAVVVDSVEIVSGMETQLDPVTFDLGDG